MTDALKDYLFKDPDYLNFGRVREGAANIIQIFDAEPDSEYIKALYFVDQGTLYW